MVCTEVSNGYLVGTLGGSRRSGGRQNSKYRVATPSRQLETSSQKLYLCGRTVELCCSQRVDLEVEEQASTGVTSTLIHVSRAIRDKVAPEEEGVRLKCHRDPVVGRHVRIIDNSRRDRAVHTACHGNWHGRAGQTARDEIYGCKPTAYAFPEQDSSLGSVFGSCTFCSHRILEQDQGIVCR